MSASTSTTHRPVTSKARGICRYYDTPRGCFAGKQCKFLHGQPPADSKPDDPPMLTLYDQSKRCRFYAAGFCKRGGSCWFLHELDGETSRTQPSEEQDDEHCSICFEKPAIYGLLVGCSHTFCLDCIKQWRDSQGRAGATVDSGNTKKCPMCRAKSRFVTPSSRFWKEGTEEKVKVIQAYKESMAKVPCRYFQRSYQRSEHNPKCPYGKDCFYQHLKPDGAPYIFRHGIETSMRDYSRLNRGSTTGFEDFHFLNFDMDVRDWGERNGALDRLFGPPVQPAANQETDTGLASAARRLQQVGESLELLNDAISEGATLDRLRAAIETLRINIARNEGIAANAEPREGDEDEDLRRDEDDVMERLEILADQMLASVNVLRMGGAREGGETPAAEPIADEGRRVDDDASSVESMPQLQSISNSSESNWEDASEGNANESDDSSHNRAISPTIENEEEVPAANPPFITDGRGRVVWSSGEEGDKEPEGESGAQEADGESSNGRQGLLGWLNSLF